MDMDLQQLLIFAAVVTCMGCTTKIILSIVNRRKNELPRDVGPALAEIADRLTRLEQAVDTTALEVERIAEGQRFTTKLLSESSALRVESAGR